MTALCPLLNEKKTGRSSIHKLLFRVSWILLCLACFPGFQVQAQLTFGYSYGHNNVYNVWMDNRKVCQLADGGYVVAGHSSAIVLHRLDSSGNLLWAKRFRDSYNEALGIEATRDGGFVIVGKLTINQLDEEVWILKYDAEGLLQWQKAYGGYFWDNGYAIQQTTDGGYIVAATSQSFSDGSPWVLKLDSDGGIQWQKQYPWSVFGPQAVHQTSDGGYVLTGYSSLGDRPALGVLRLDGQGEALWQKNYLWGSWGSWGASVVEAEEGGYFIAGTTYCLCESLMDYWLLRLDKHGQILWERQYPCHGYDIVGGIVKGDSSGYIIVGQADLTAWVIKVDPMGNRVWQKYFPQQTTYQNVSGAATGDGGIILAGGPMIESNDHQTWLLKMQADGSMDPSCTMGEDTYAMGTPTHAAVEEQAGATETTWGIMQDTQVSTEELSFSQSLFCTSGPYVTQVSGRKRNPYRIFLVGAHFQSDAKVYLGDQNKPWRTTKVKSENLIVLKGAGLRAIFNRWPVKIHIVNGDGGETYYTVHGER